MSAKDDSAFLARASNSWKANVDLTILGDGDPRFPEDKIVRKHFNFKYIPRYFNYSSILSNSL